MNAISSSACTLNPHNKLFFTRPPNTPLPHLLITAAQRALQLSARNFAGPGYIVTTSILLR